MNRPVGLSAGGVGLLLSWFGGFAIAQLTGATPIVIVLAAGVVLFVAATFDGLFTAMRTSVHEVVLPRSSVQGDAVPLTGTIVAPRPVWVEIRAGGSLVAQGWTTRTDLRGDAVFVERGPVTDLDVRVRTAGLLGLVWWGRRVTVPIDEHLVAPAAHHGSVPVERVGIAADGDLAGASGAISGEIDGVRPWQEGDSEKFVHWTSTLRAGELVVHDRRRNADQRWCVRARAGTAEPDVEAGAARWAIEEGLRSGASVTAAVDDGEAELIDGVDAAIEWATRVDLGPAPAVQRSWRDRFRRVEPEATASVAARWWAAGATWVALWMLTGALQSSPATWALVGAGVAVGAAVSARSAVTGDDPPTLVRVGVGLGALLAFGMVVASSGRLDGLLSILRGPLPQVLMILIVLHGFECRDRRTIRVALGISAVVLMYASGLRVDGQIVWWLLAWGIAFGVAMAKLAGPTAAMVDPWHRRLSDSAAPLRDWGRRGAGLLAASAATFGLLAVVPVPAGAARLTLPTLIENADPVGTPGAVVGPDGEVRDDAPIDDESAPVDRAPAGQAGGYTGFAETMDTSVRGNLSDQVVMRVRAPEPDFWRGQTFSRFDGRRWYADDDIGTLRQGPNFQVPPALGDIPVADDVQVDRFVQTYFLETDMPNLIFHSMRPQQVVAEADAFARPDGALRATTTLPAGSVYTVVSDRVRVDAQLLARQGHVGERLTDLGRRALARYLEVPATTTPETVALASDLAAGETSTYGVVRSFEAWMSENVEYDLRAPLPDRGEDAVHDFLFDSQLGFCEQIASSLTIMLRTQGIPARLAAGYVSGSRDEVAGVFEVRASDAHAWVEVWFPETGWQAFDPTAAVPLSADAEISSVGGDMAAALGTYVSERPWRALALAFGVSGGLGLFRIVRQMIARRRRGRWGGLQDRFTAAAVERGAHATASNPVLASAWSADPDADVATRIASQLDRVAFDPAFVDADDTFDETRRLVGSLAE